VSVTELVGSAPRRLFAGRPRKSGEWLVIGAVTVAALGFGAFVAWFAARFPNSELVAFIVLPVAPLLFIATVVNPLVGALAIVAAFPIGSAAAPVGELRIQAVEVAVFVAALVVMIRRLSVGRTPLPFAGPLGWALALFIWVFITFYAAIDKTAALKALFTLFGGIAAAMVVLAACRRQRDVRVVIGAVVLVGAGIAVTTIPTLGEIRTEYGGAYITEGRLEEGTFTHPNQLGAFFALTAPLAASMLLVARTRSVQILMGLALVAILVGLMATLSRGAWIATAVAALLMLARLKEARRLLVFFAVPTLIVGAFAWSLTPSAAAEFDVVGERAQALTVRSPYDDRDVIYSEALREIREEPLLGQGPGAFPIASRRAVSESATLSYDHAHNLYLNWGAEAGLIAVALILGFGVALFLTALSTSRGARRSGDWRTRILVVGLGASLLTVAVQGLFDYVIANPVMHTAVWLVIGALLAVARGPETAGR
jgi:O-antigen ligase